MKNLARLLLFSIGCVGALVVGVKVLFPGRPFTRSEAADLIDRFIEGETNSRNLTCVQLSSLGVEWECFLHAGLGKDEDPLIREIAAECSEIYDEYPPDQRGSYCNADGLARLGELRDQLRSNQTRE